MYRLRASWIYYFSVDFSKKEKKWSTSQRIKLLKKKFNLIRENTMSTEPVNWFSADRLFLLFLKKLNIKLNFQRSDWQKKRGHIQVKAISESN